MKRFGGEMGSIRNSIAPRATPGWSKAGLKIDQNKTAKHNKLVAVAQDIVNMAWEKGESLAPRVAVAVAVS